MFEFNFFPLGLEPLLLAVRGSILRCPTKVADRRMTIGRCRWQLPEIRSSCNNEEDFSLLAMNTEAIRQRHVTFASLKSTQGQQGAAGQTFPSPCGAASQSLCRLPADSCTGESSAKRTCHPCSKPAAHVGNGSMTLTSVRP